MSSTDNLTTLTLSHDRHYVITKATFAIFVIFSFFTIVGNLLVIVTFWKDPYKELRSTYHSLVLNLAVSDLLMGLIGEPLGLVSLHWSSLHKAACTVVYISLIASCLTILSLAAERYIFLTHPLMSTTAHRLNLKLAVACIWFIACLLGVLPIIAWHSDHSYRLFLADTVGLLVMVLMIAFYVRIFVLIRRWHLRLKGAKNAEEVRALTRSGQATQLLRKKHNNILKAIIVFTGAFALCWTPSIVAENLVYICSVHGHPRVQCISDKVADTFNMVGFLSCVINPAIYAVWSPKFRKALRRIYLA